MSALSPESRSLLIQIRELAPFESAEVALKAALEFYLENAVSLQAPCLEDADEAKLDKRPSPTVKVSKTRARAASVRSRTAESVALVDF